MKGVEGYGESSHVAGLETVAVRKRQEAKLEVEAEYVEFLFNRNESTRGTVPLNCSSTGFLPVEQLMLDFLEITLGQQIEMVRTC